MPDTIAMTREDEKAVAAFLEKQETKAIKALSLLAKQYRKRFEKTEHFWSGLSKDRSGSIGFFFIELAGGADFPRVYLLNDARKDLVAFEGAIKSRDWKKIPKLLKNAEARINRFHQETTEYWNDISSGATRAISITKFAQGAGMVATGVLCTTFAAPTVAARLAVLGVTEATAGGLAVPAACASAGGVIATQINGIASGLGKVAAGTKIDLYKSGMAQLKETVEAGVFGLIAGPFSKWLNTKIAGDALSQLEGKALKAALARGRLTAPTAKKIIETVWKSYWSKSGKKVTKVVVRKLKGHENVDAVALMIMREAAKDPKFQKAFLEELEKQQEKAN